MTRRTPPENEENLHAERRLQVSAALGLGLLVLLTIVLRVGVRNVFPVGWWRHW